MTSEASESGSVRRSWAIVRAAFEALRQNPRLVWFPVLSGVGALVLAAIGAAIVATGSLGAELDASAQRASSVAGIVVYIGGYLLAVTTGVAMNHAALEALAGRPWTVRQAFEVASRRRRAIATFAVVSATVGHLLRGRKRGSGGGRRRPGPIRRLAGVAWWAATYLTLPVIARENRDAFGAIERSASLLRSTWKEMLVARLTLWWAWIPVAIVAALPVLLCALLGVREPVFVVLAAAIPLVGLCVLALVVRTLDGIYRAALYTYATEGVVPEPFDNAELGAIWEAPGVQDETS
jgi:hypothetical protein